MTKTLNLVKNIILAILLVILIFFSLALFSQRTHIGEYSTYVVLSGSMKPAFDAGDVIVLKKTEADFLTEGDIISFNDPNIPGKIITHRITSIKTQGNQEVFTTKGDANKDMDTRSVSPPNVLGKVVSVIPKIGYLIEFSKSKWGFVLLILIPGLVLIGSEMVSLAKYIKTLEEKDRKNDTV